MGVVVVKLTHAIARVVKRIEVWARRRATFGTGVAAVTLLPVCWSWALTFLRPWGRGLLEYPTRCPLLSQQLRASCGFLRRPPPSWKAVGILKTLSKRDPFLD